MVHTMAATALRRQTRLIFLWMSYVPGLFHRREVVAAAGHLAFMREALDPPMYQRLGIQYAKRSRPLGDVRAELVRPDLAATCQQGGASALDVPALAAAYGRLFDVLERHLHALSEQIGGGFEHAWYRRLSERIKQGLAPFGQPAGARPSAGDANTPPTL